MAYLIFVHHGRVERFLELVVLLDVPIPYILESFVNSGVASRVQQLTSPGFSDQLGKIVVSLHFLGEPQMKSGGTDLPV